MPRRYKGPRDIISGEIVPQTYLVGHSVKGPVFLGPIWSKRFWRRRRGKTKRGHII